MPDFPILVERFKPGQVTELGCPDCGERRQATKDEVESCEPETVAECGCGSWFEWAYVEADKCPGCGALGFYDHGKALAGCCSRKCVLVAEYARELAARRESA